MLEHTTANTSARDIRGLTPLHRAALHGHLSCTKILLEHSPQILNSKDNFGWTPLHLACQSGDTNTVVYILSQKPRLTFDDDGGSALHKAAVLNQDKIVEVMVQEHGWDLNIVSNSFYLLLSEHAYAMQFIQVMMLDILRLMDIQRWQEVCYILFCLITPTNIGQISKPRTVSESAHLKLSLEVKFDQDLAEKIRIKDSRLFSK